MLDDEEDLHAPPHQVSHGPSSLVTPDSVPEGLVPDLSLSIAQPPPSWCAHRGPDTDPTTQGKAK